MTAKEIYHGDQARQALAEGMRCLVEAVGVTAGPCGRNVMIQTGINGVRVTKDGYTIAQSLELGNKFGNAGASLLRHLAYHSDERAGDGSTAGIVMAGCIIEETLKAMTAGLDHGKVREAVYRAFDEASNILSESSRTLLFPEDLYKVAYIASNGDEKIASELADIFADGDFQKKVLIKNGTAAETHIEQNTGFRIGAGFATPWLVNDFRENSCVLDKPRVLIVEGKINSLQPLVPLLEQVVRENDSLLLVAEDFGADVLSGLVVNNRNAGLKAAAVKIPRMEKTAIVEDLSAASGATCLSENAGDSLEKSNLNVMTGTLESARLEKDQSWLELPRSCEAAAKRQTGKLKTAIENAENREDQEKLEERIAALQSTLVTINVGGLNETEIAEKKDRYHDALNSLQTALKEGVVPGGGTVFLMAARVLLKHKTFSSPEMQSGYNIAIKALKAPAERIFANAGLNERHTVEKILQANDSCTGFDVRKGGFTNMYKAGIIDSAIVAREALNLARSISNVMLGTDAAIVEYKKEAS